MLEKTVNDVVPWHDAHAVFDNEHGDPVMTRTIRILYATETGTAEEVARNLAGGAEARGLCAILADLADCDIGCLTDTDVALLITSTTGEGDAPYSAEAFFRDLASDSAPSLPGLHYAVLALGDSSYQQFCAAGRMLDERLATTGAKRLLERIDCDIDYEEPAADWQLAVLDLLSDRTGESQSAAELIAASRQDKPDLIDVIVVENRLLVGEGSTKATRHLSLALVNGENSHDVGDALGIVVENDPEMVATVLACARLSGDTLVTLRGTSLPLHEALSGHLEITTVTPRFIEGWSHTIGLPDLRAALSAGHHDDHTLIARSHQIVDVIKQYPAQQLDAQSFVAMLRPLQPRLYSIASSPRAIPNEVHLTVGPVTFTLHGDRRSGVATGQLSTRTPIGSRLKVYIQPNPHFRLPDPTTPIIMIGAGTGVAPFRAFLQERAASQPTGPAWLFFGERNRETDFLYATEFDAFLRTGVLTRINAAFSRDAEAKVYVQHRLLEEAREFAKWLLAGAHVYVCGDAANMAPDVHQALIEAIATGGEMSNIDAEVYLAEMQKDGRYQRDVY